MMHNPDPHQIFMPMKLKIQEALPQSLMKLDIVHQEMAQSKEMAEGKFLVLEFQQNRSITIMPMLGTLEFKIAAKEISLKLVANHILNQEFLDS